MSLLRLILFLIIFWVVLSAIRSLLGGRKKKASRPERLRTDGEEMVLDPQCHSYIPKSAALLKSGQYFCSQECARLYLTR
jgi:hypothetical protein